MGVFAVGIGLTDADQPPVIGEDQWEEVFPGKDLDWNSDLVPVQVMVELPFWILIPDHELRVTYQGTELQAKVRGAFTEIQEGPVYRLNHANTVYVGPVDGVSDDELELILAKAGQCPIWRNMRTVIVFDGVALADGFTAYSDTQIRRINTGDQYFHSLAYAHLPFLNKIITSYRSVSYDPCAFEVGVWDVPIWFIQRGDELVRTQLMPYFDNERYPSLDQFGSSDRMPYCSTQAEAVQSQLSEDVAPGKLELLDALSLSYRGRFGDAVRAAVTAIEVALEAQFAELLRRKGHSPEQVQGRLKETYNKFEARLSDFEKVRQRRLPGPILSLLPYINGVMLKAELGWVRGLRHKVVHEGIRIDIFAEREMQRVIETMTWLYDWLSWDDKHTARNQENVGYFAAMHGNITIPFEYTRDGIRLKAQDLLGDDVPELHDLRWKQYYSTITDRGGSLDHFVAMTLAHYKLYYVDAPPENEEEHILRERFHIRDGKRNALVFCPSFDRLMDLETLSGIALRAMAHARLNGPNWGVLCIVHHQRNFPMKRRELEQAIPQKLVKIATECGITIITAIDLLFLVKGHITYGWNTQQLQDLFFIPGRQGLVPPSYRLVGSLVNYFPAYSAVSVQLEPGEIINVGDTIGLRLLRGYHEEKVESLQVNREPQSSVTGPARAAIQMRLTKSDLRIGQAIFIRD